MAKQKNNGDFYEKVPQLHDDNPSKLREQISKGFGALLVIGFGILLYFAFLRLAEIFTGFSFVINMLTPVIYGLVIAYLLNPLVKKLEGILLRLGGEKWRENKKFKKWVCIASIFASLIVFLWLIFCLCYLVIPEVLDSVYNLILTLPDQINAVIASISKIEISHSELATELESIAIDMWTNLRQWLQTDLLAQMNSIMSNVTIGVVLVIDWVFDVIMGIILSVYILLNKDLFLGQAKKSMYALMPAREANITLHILSKSNRIFGGFIIGKILDSMLMGVITFVVLSIMNMPYTLLVSVIIGVTNVVPYFGPFIGAIPCAILILLQSPIQGIYFIIYIIILQQVDGNIIGPKILGDSTGLNSFWVIIAVMLGSGLFGFVGMVIGVPTFAVIYYIVGLFINQKLERKNLPTDSMGYDSYCYVDDESGAFVASHDEDKKNAMETEVDIKNVMENVMENDMKNDIEIDKE